MTFLEIIGLIALAPWVIAGLWFVVTLVCVILTEIWERLF